MFDPSQVSGFDTTDYVGTVGSPDLISNLRATFTRDDWSFNYYVQYVHGTNDRLFYNEETTYFGYDPAFRDYTMGSAFNHSISVFYRADNWDVLVGINNLFDKEPGQYSSGGASRRGNTNINATQYDLLGRRVFARVNYRF